MKKLVIVGASALGKKLIQVLQASASSFQVELMGFLNEEGPTEIYQEFGLLYLGKISDAIIDSQVRYWVAEQEISKRIKLMEVISGQGGRFFSFVDSSAVIGNFVTLGDGVVIGPNAYIGDYSHIGSFSLIHAGVIIRKYVSVGLFCQLGKSSIIGEGVSIGDGNTLGKNSYLKSFERVKQEEFVEFMFCQGPFFTGKIVYNFFLN